MTRAYYNEFDPYAAQWLRNLISAGHIAPGDVDERSIVDVRPSDLSGYTQAHFFAGIGGWSYALRLAGVSDDRPVWTGSCPCQPFSAAGKQRAGADERHLWPEFLRLIGECQPAEVFGEQVASKLGRIWLAGVRADLEALGYDVGAADLCSAGVGAPHIRQRIWWVADRDGGRQPQLEERDGGPIARLQAPRRDDAGGCGVAGRLADTGAPGRRALQRPTGTHGRSSFEPDRYGDTIGLGNAGGQGLPQRVGDGRLQPEALGSQQGQAPVGRSNLGFWSRYDVVHCTDGKARRIEPGSFPLAHGVPSRVGRLRGYGNAIVPQVAAQFIRAAFDARRDVDALTEAML